MSGRILAGSGLVTAVSLLWVIVDGINPEGFGSSKGPILLSPQTLNPKPMPSKLRKMLGRRLHSIPLTTLD